MLVEIALAMMLFPSTVDMDESVRYERLAQLEQERIAYSEEVGNYSEEWYEPEYYETYYEPYWMDYDLSDGVSPEEFQFYGYVDEGGVHYTWYSQNVLPGGGLTELNENGRHVEGGYVVDGDGYIAVASSDYEKGTVLDTPFGAAKVYDTGCASGTVDVYTDF